MSGAASIRAATMILCAAIAFVSADGPRWIEAGGGLSSSLVVQLCTLGSLVFAVCALLSLMSSHLSGPFCVLAAMMCVPMYFLLVAPRLIDSLSSLPSSLVLANMFVWNDWAAGGLLSLLLLFLVLPMTKTSQARR